MSTIPDFRSVLRADVGCLAFRMDESQAENRVVAYIAQEENMVSAFRDKKDIHVRTASLIFGRPEDEISPKERQLGKTCNHALNYGMSARAFSLHLMQPEREAQILLEAYHRAYPMIRCWQARVRESLQRNRTLVDLHGNSRIFLGHLDHTLYKVGYSYIPQSTVAYQVLRYGMQYIWDNFDLSEVMLLNQVHDDIWFQIPCSVSFERMAEIILSIKRNMEHPLTTASGELVIPVDVAVGNLAEMEDLNVEETSRLDRCLSEAYRRYRA